MSDLASYQRAVVTLAFAEDDAPLPALPGFAIYRELIRTRLFAMAQLAFARSFAGDARGFADCFARYLAACPPASPLIREVIGEFGPWAEREASGVRASALRFETAVWRVGSAPYETPHDVRELDFDGALVLNSTLQRVQLDYDVAEGERTLADPHTLFVYRRGPEAADGDDVHWCRLARVAALLAEPEGTLGERVARLYAGADQQALEALAAELTAAVERGIVLGVR